MNHKYFQIKTSIKFTKINSSFSKRIMILVFVAILSLSFVHGQQAQAAPFNKNNLISDPLFTDTDSMTVSQIQAFLESKGSLLANWRDTVTMRRPGDNCVVHHATGKTAAQIIHEASNGWRAQVYNSNGCAIQGAYWDQPAYSGYKLKTVSPKVILATLQKEQSLVTANGTYSTNQNDYKNPDCCSNNTYKLAYAMGYGVPDNGSINKKYLGFYNQVNWAAWQFRFNYERAAGNTAWDGVSYITYTGPMIEGTFRRCGSCTLQAFDGYYPIDGSPLYMGNRSTASLYYYTPHTYPGFYGNYNFVQFYSNWFGSTQQVVKMYDSKVVSVKKYVNSGRTTEYGGAMTLQPGGTGYVTVTIKNTGYLAWDQSDLRLGTIKPQNKKGVFKDDSWLSPGRAAAPNEATIEPGENATFTFSMTAPDTIGTYAEKLRPILENIAWFGKSISIPANVVSPVSPIANDNILESGETMYPGDYLLSTDRHKTLVFGGRGNILLYNNFKVVWDTDTANQNATRLVMQSDGNLVLLAGSTVLWSSGTNGNPGAYLEIRTNGNARVTDGTSTLWTSDTTFHPDGLRFVNTRVLNGKLFPGQQIQTANRKYRLIMQTDGNLVIYSSDKPVWSTGTHGLNASYFSVQGDGNMVLYNSEGKGVWSTRTNGYRNAYLRVQTDGNLVLYSQGGKALWKSGTRGR